MKKFKFLFFAVAVITIAHLPKMIADTIGSVRWHNNNHYPEFEKLIVVEIKDFYMFINPENDYSVDGMPKKEWDKEVKKICIFCRDNRHPLTKVFKKLNIIEQTEGSEYEIFHAHNHGYFYNRSENEIQATTCCHRATPE